MSEVRDEIGHELAVLLALIDSVTAPCERLPAAAAYPSSSTEFFRSISELGKKSREHLCTFPASTETIEESEEEFGSPPEELAEIKSAWKELHPYIAPAVQADTLHQPTALVAALTRRFREIERFEQSTFTIFLADEFNYLHLYASEIAELTNRLAKLIGAPKLPQFGLIGIPSSQSSALFFNCLIAHEMGHYAAANRRFLPLILGEAEEALKLTMKERYPTDSGSLQIPAKLGKWAEELFCDLFAVQLIGPCYTFAYIELYDLLQILKFDRTLHPKRIQTALSFFQSYPSHIYRIQQQALMLKNSGWWTHLHQMKCRHFGILEQLITITEQDHKQSNPDNIDQVDAFLKIVPEVSRFVGSVTGKLDDHAHEFGMLNQTVLAYLEEGIVPSTLNVRDGGNAELSVMPSFVTLINSGMNFYLEHIPSLMGHVVGQNKDSTDQRAYWMRKVESWVAKALEDIQLRETLGYGCANSKRD